VFLRAYRVGRDYVRHNMRPRNKYIKAIIDIKIKRIRRSLN